MEQQPLAASKPPSDEAGPRAELTIPGVTIAFMLAGNAYVTFQSQRTGVRFTYHVEQAELRPGQTTAPHLVSVLTSPDFYEYLGVIFERRTYMRGVKSAISNHAPSAVAFAWVWRTLSAGKMHPDLSVWHEGRCGKCGRRLTTPESIASGLGPICASRGEDR